ncbi:hypothetical protein JKP88DRAFT_348172 [Tribonema minus]|uniref:Crossover junction endonuclease EME1 n=1 Tax=Tribonema minus TaxID=303371 RepID=A0A836CHI1_9STRA|nr:hypothetical protein JKP88DRAFT_348172 [Tribonema minus]
MERSFSASRDDTAFAPRGTRQPPIKNNGCSPLKKSSSSSSANGNGGGRVVDLCIDSDSDAGAPAAAAAAWGLDVDDDDEVMELTPPSYSQRSDASEASSAGSKRSARSAYGGEESQCSLTARYDGLALASQQSVGSQYGDQYDGPAFPSQQSFGSQHSDYGGAAFAAVSRSSSSNSACAGTGSSSKGGGGGGSKGGGGDGASSQRGGGSSGKPSGGGGGSGGGGDDGEPAPKRKRARLTPEEREARERAKAQEKADKAAARAAAKAESAAAKAREKEGKARAKLERAVATGRHVAQEVACVLDAGWLDAMAEPDRAALTEAAARQGDDKEAFKVLQARGAVRGAIWWTRRGLLDGGAAAEGDGVSIMQELRVVAVDPAEFADALAVPGAPPDTYPGVGALVDAVAARLCGGGAGGGAARVLLLLQGVARELHRRVAARHRAAQRAGAAAAAAAAACPGEDALQDCLAWLMVARGVEARVTRTPAETGQYLWDLTRALAHGPYRAALTDLHCVSRAKVTVAGGALCGADNAGGGATAADVWLRQLMQVPGVSEPKARNIVRAYPSARRLVHAFTDPAQPQPAALLAHVMSERRELVLSERVYRFFTTRDPDMVVM